MIDSMHWIPLRRALWLALGATGGFATLGCVGSKAGGATASNESTDDIEQPAACEPDLHQIAAYVCFPVAPGTTSCDDACDADCRAELMGATECGCGCQIDSLCGAELVDGECCVWGLLVEGGCTDSGAESGTGRPYVVAGRSVAAPATAHTRWVDPARDIACVPNHARAGLAAHFVALARAEHASIPAFARCTLDLVGLGAPAELLLETQAALLDEIAHAKTAFAIASMLSGHDVGPGPLPEALAEQPARSPADVLHDVVTEGCIAETISAAVAGVDANSASIEGLANAMQTIATDETRHAALAWKTARFILSRHPELNAVARTAFDTARAARRARGAGSIDPSLRAVGLADARARRGIADEVWRTLIEPAAQRLLAESSPDPQ